MGPEMLSAGRSLAVAVGGDFVLGDGVGRSSALAAGPARRRRPSGWRRAPPFVASPTSCPTSCGTVRSSHAGTSPTSAERHGESQSGPSGRQPARETQLAAGRSLTSRPDVSTTPNSKPARASVRELSQVPARWGEYSDGADMLRACEKAPRQISRRETPLAAAPPTYATASVRPGSAGGWRSRYCFCLRLVAEVGIDVRRDQDDASRGVGNPSSFGAAVRRSARCRLVVPIVNLPRTGGVRS